MERARGMPVTFVTPAGFDATQPAGVIVSSPKIVFSGLVMAFGQADSDLRLAFDRLRRATEPFEPAERRPLFVSAYALSAAGQEKANSMRRELRPPGTSLVFEGLPALDATVALDMVALGK